MNPLSEFEAGWPVISALLDEALEMPASEHAHWLDSLAGERATHRETLRKLLASRAVDETDDFLGSMPALGPRALEAAAAEEAAGSQVGVYRLIEQIGRGGMGIVWLAERSDGTMKRRVALKLPRVAWGSSFAERLAREREILATLEHQHIARLYDAGVDAQGRPFLAMEYVEGESLSDYCSARAPTVRARIGLLLQVMAAVAHAHARLVVHRDLKPGNILVTHDGQVRLLDFGIAKLLEGDRTQETELTELGGRALTLDYASPEQIRGEPLGTASDIYSMAVVAYELLSGARPYQLKRGSAAELEEAIASVAPRLASDSAADAGTARQLRGDIDSILNKGLKKLVADRYQTMDAFSQDLQRYLDGQPVEARPDGWAYLAAKFVHRHRLQVAAAAIVAVALVAGTSVALWQAREARRAATTAQAVQGFIESVFNANSRYQANPTEAAAVTARELLDRGAERVDKELAAEPEAQLRLYDLLAQMYAGMSLNERSHELYRRSLALATRLHGEASDAALTAATGLGSMLTDLNRRDEALLTLLRADTVAKGRRNDRDLARMNIDTLLARAYYGVDLPQGLARARGAGAIARMLGPSTDGINTLTILGVLANESGALEESRKALSDAVAWVGLLNVEGVLPNILSSLAEVQNELGQLDAAAGTLTRSIALAEQQGDPIAILVGRYRLARFQYQNLLLRQGVETAAPEAARMLALTADPKFSDLPVVVLVNYARILLAYGDGARSFEVLEQARPHMREMPNRLAPFLAARADALVALGRLPEAGVDIERAVALMPGTGERIIEGILAVRRRYWVAIGQPDKALKDLADNPLKGGESNTPVKRLRRQADEATLLLAAGQVEPARAAAATVLAAIDKSPERKFFGAVEARMNGVLGQALLKQDRVAESLPVLEKALALSVVEYDPEHDPVTATLRLSLEEARRRAAR